jgi:EAL domain-containing protein (putative c-di-GMP-specific phosphodiesterase class I)
MRPVAPTDAFTLMRLPAADPAGRLEANARTRFGVAQAIAQRRIAFHYQPVVRAADPRFPAFFECLARIRLPDGGTLPAAGFMATIEAGPLGRVLDRLALEHALAALAADPGLRLSINMSPLSMGDEAWLALLAAAPRRACDRLILEITEDAAIGNAELTLDFMRHVRARGCAFAIDDFGAGATGFKYFRDFRFDMVKIDGGFVQGVHAARDAQVLVECLKAVAGHFEMVTVAEHVDNEADAAWLRRLGIDCLQGYLYGRPRAEPRLDAEAPAAARLAG